MAHEFETGFFVRTPAWHKLGTVIGDAPTVEDGIRLAGLDWLVEEHGLTAHHPSTGAIKPVPSHKGLFRATDQHLLGVVGKDYQVFQNVKAFAFINSFVESGACKLDAAGSLRGGRRVWVLCSLPNLSAEIVAGDSIRGYLLVSNAHDGSAGVRVQFTAVRVVCMNTMQMAEDAGDTGRENYVSVRHDKNLHVSMETVSNCIDIANRTFSISVDRYRRLAGAGIEIGRLREYVREVFDYADEPATDMPMSWNYIKDMFTNGPGVNTIPGVSGSWWAALNAVTDWIDHGESRGRNPASRLHSSWFGAGQAMRAKAVRIAEHAVN